MEKHLCSIIVRHLDPRKRETRDTYFDHSIEDAAESFLNLIENIVKDDRLINTIRGQGAEFLYIPGCDFKDIHNYLRYPFFMQDVGGVGCLNVSKSNVNILTAKLKFIKGFVGGVDAMLADVSYCQMSWMAPETQAAIFFTPSTN